MHTPARAVWMVLGGILSVQLGASFSKQLFDEVPPAGMVWLRLASSAVVLLLVARPWRLRALRPDTRSAPHRRRDWLVVLAFGATLATMNWAIYESFSRIPLGVAVTIEFLGPLGVALAASRRALDLVWVALAGLGVALLGLDGTGVTLSGVLFALLAAASWAAYIPLSAATGRHWPGLSGLAVASAVGAAALAPYALHTAGATLVDPSVLTVGVLVGLLSSVIPYSLELTALRTMPTKVFGILMSLEPAAAALVGVVVLREMLGPSQWAAVACVVAASVGVTRAARWPHPPDHAPPALAGRPCSGHRRARSSTPFGTPSPMTSTPTVEVRGDRGGGSCARDH